MKGEVPEGEYVIPFGQANIVREGKDATHRYLRHDGAPQPRSGQTAGKRRRGCGSNRFAHALAARHQHRVPIGGKTGRLVVVDEASPRCNIATNISAQVCQEMFGKLKSGIRMVSPPHTPVPFSAPLEKAYLPNGKGIAETVRQTL